MGSCMCCDTRGASTNTSGVGRYADRPNLLRRLCSTSDWSLVILVLSQLGALAAMMVLPMTEPITMSGSFGFKPMSDGASRTWNKVVFVLVPVVLFPLVGCAITNHNYRRTTHCLFFVASAGYAALLISGNALSRRETAKRVAIKQAFAVQFNQFYCNTRTLRACLSGSDGMLLVLTHGNLSTTVQSSENVTEAGLAIWSRCHEVLRESIAREASLEIGNKDDIEQEGEIEVEPRSYYAFHSASNHSQSLDAWCGSLKHRATPLSDEEQLSFPSAYAQNPDMFVRYTEEWPKRMLIANLMLGSILACLVLGAVAFVVCSSRGF